ncbi:MAG: IS110 family transposase [Calditrichaeota bacterium]|nr:IS110 family transposase [Bacteroidales bacterium]RQV92185.1 MAG: IS110 family transposase [Calditrichota bacterium]
MQTMLKYSVGTDLSKETFDACFSVIDSQQKVTIKSTRKFDNTISGIKNFIGWSKKLRKHDIPIVFTMEATGIYYERLALALYEEEFYVSVVLPNKAKKYMQSIGQKSKNDKIDAKGLSRMGAEQQLACWMPFSRNIYQLRLLTRQNEDLQQQRTILINRKEAHRFCQDQNEIIDNQLGTMLNLVEQQLKQINNAIIRVIEEDTLLKEKIFRISKIKGLGILTVATVVAETNGFYLFKNQRQLVSYAGYDIIENQSGNRKGKTKISKKGNSHIRRVLHMPAFNVVRYEQGSFKNLYDRVYMRTNKKMKAYVAVQRKLLMLIYTLWNNNTEFDSNYHKSSGNDEPKFLFSLGFEKAVKKVVPVKNTRTTQDELPCNESPEVLFSLIQNY